MDLKALIVSFEGNLMNVDMKNINISGCDLSEILLPEDKELFQKIRFKNIRGCTFKNFDFSKYNMNGVSFKDVRCVGDCKFPKNKDFLINLNKSDISGCDFLLLDNQDFSCYIFDGVNIENVKFNKTALLPQSTTLLQVIKNRSLAGVMLPCIDFSNYIFDDVILVNTKFYSDSVLPKNKELFQIIKDKNITCCELPTLDYSYYNMKDVCMICSKFTDSAVMPKDYAFIKNLKGYYGVKFGQELLDNLHLYDLNGLSSDFLNHKSVKPLQMKMILKKYPHKFKI